MKSKVSNSSLFILPFPPSQGGLGRVSLSHATHHPDARADGRKDGDERLNHDFPNFTFIHGGKGLKFKVQGSKFKVQA